MKKLLKIALVMLLALSMVACAKEPEKDPEPTPADDGTVKIAVLLPFTGDQSYFDTLAIAAREVDAADNGIKVDLYEVDPNGTVEETLWMNAYANVCEDADYDLVVSGNDSYEGFLFKAAEKYPDQLFYDFDYSNLPESGVPKNLYAVNWALDDLGYVVGTLSAALTKTGIVGVVVGKDIPPMNQFISGYVQVLADKGVKYVISYPDSFTDTALGKETANKMIEKGADVIWQVAGGLGNGVIDACSEHEDVWCVGVDQDQYAQFAGTNDAWAKTIITSALKNTNVAFKAVCEMVKNGTYSEKLGKAESWGIALNGVGLAENDYYHANVSEEIRAEIASTLEKVAKGEVQVYDCLESADYNTEWPKYRDANRVE
jgi:basic membrane protein A